MVRACNDSALVEKNKSLHKVTRQSQPSIADAKLGGYLTAVILFRSNNIHVIQYPLRLDI